MSKKKNPEIPKVEPQNPAKATAEGMVVGTEPQPVAVPTVMVEQVDSVAEARKAIKDPAKEKISRLIDQHMFMAKPELDAMVVAGEIGTYTVLKKGQSFSGDYQSDRVQLYVHGPAEKITDIQVG